MQLLPRNLPATWHSTAAYALWGVLACIHPHAISICSCALTWLSFLFSAFVCHVQGAHGLVQSTGDGYWLFRDALLSYTPTVQASSGRLQSSALALAVALPVVFGVLLLAGGAVLAWWWCKRLASRWGDTAAAACVLARIYSRRCCSVAWRGKVQSGRAREMSAILAAAELHCMPRVASFVEAVFCSRRRGINGLNTCRQQLTASLGSARSCGLPWLLLQTPDTRQGQPCR